MRLNRFFHATGANGSRFVKNPDPPVIKMSAVGREQRRRSDNLTDIAYAPIQNRENRIRFRTKHSLNTTGSRASK